MSFTFLYFKYTSTYLCKNIFASVWCCRVRMKIPFTHPTYLKNLRTRILHFKTPDPQPWDYLEELCVPGGDVVGALLLVLVILG